MSLLEQSEHAAAGDSSLLRSGEGFVARFLIVPKLLYLLLNMCVYSTYNFTGVYFEDVWGIPIHSYGFIAALTTIGFLGSILWTMLADRTGRHKSILILASLGFAGTFCLLRLEPFHGPEYVWQKYLFVSLVFCVSNFFCSALYPLLDNRIFAILLQNPNFSTKLYGKQRLWGSIGQAIATQLNSYGIATALSYDSMFINLAWSTAAFILVVILAVPSKLQPRTETMAEGIKDAAAVPMEAPILSTSSSAHESAKKKSVFTPVRTLLSKSQFCWFIALALSAGYVRAILGHYVVSYFKNVMKLSSNFYGLAMQTRLVSELALFFIGKTLLTRIGAFWVMMIGLLAGALRSAAYAVLPISWTWVPFVSEFLKGVNSACVIQAGVRIAHSLAPPGCEATAQGFFSGIQAYLANALAGCVGAVTLKIYEKSPFALNTLFLHTAIVSFVTCIIYAVKERFRPFPE